MEITFSGLTEETEWLYKKYKAWYESQNVKIMMEEIFMRSDLSEVEVPSVKLPTDFEVKSITETDEEEYYECYYEAFKAGKDRLFLDQTEKQRREGFQEYFDRSRPFNEEASIVLMKNNRIYGFSFVRPRGEEGHLALIGIHPDFQRKNLGKTLLYLIIKKLAQQGLKTISLGVDPVNTPAYNLYRSLGFKTVSRSVTHVWKTIST
ncbi:MAG: GNAT family N-acetyltransferase [Candidatus Hermodarchaeota archaeon]